MKKVLSMFKELAKGLGTLVKNMWAGKSKSQKRVILAAVTLAVALLNVAFPIPFISVVISGLVMGVSAGIIISSVKDILTNKYAKKVESPEESKSETKDKEKKKGKSEKLSKKGQEQHDLAKVKRAEFEKLLNENKKPLDNDTKKAMEALFTQSSSKAPSKVEEIEEVEQSSNKSFDDVFKSGK